MKNVIKAFQSSELTAALTPSSNTWSKKSIGLSDPAADHCSSEQLQMKEWVYERKKIITGIVLMVYIGGRYPEGQDLIYFNQAVFYWTVVSVDKMQNTRVMMKNG